MIETFPKADPTCVIPFRLSTKGNSGFSVRNCKILRAPIVQFFPVLDQVQRNLFLRVVRGGCSPPSTVEELIMQKSWNMQICPF